MPKEKVQKDKQRCTKHTHKHKDRVTRTTLKTGSELRFFGRVSSTCSTRGTRHVNIVTNPVISHGWGIGGEVFTTSGTYPLSLVTHIFHSGQPSHGCDHKTPEVMTSTQPRGTLASVTSFLAATPYQRNYNRYHKLWNIASTERYVLHMLVLLNCCYI
jgi:hypothetical protein